MSLAAFPFIRVAGGVMGHSDQISVLLVEDDAAARACRELKREAAARAAVAAA